MFSNRVCLAIDTNGDAVYECTACSRKFSPEDHVAGEWALSRRHKKDAWVWKDAVEWKKRIDMINAAVSRDEGCLCLSFQDLKHDIFTGRKRIDFLEGWSSLIDWKNKERERITRVYVQGLKVFQRRETSSSPGALDEPRVRDKPSPGYFSGMSSSSNCGKGRRITCVSVCVSPNICSRLKIITLNPKQVNVAAAAAAAKRIKMGMREEKVPRRVLRAQ